MQQMRHALTPQQLQYAERLADPTEQRSQDEIAQVIGVSRETLWRWRRIKDFGEFVYALALLHVKSELGQIFAALIQSARFGNVQAIRLIFEVTGVLQAYGAKKLIRDEIYTGYLDEDENSNQTIKKVVSDLNVEQRKIMSDAINRIDGKLFDWAIVTEDVSVAETTELQVIENALAA